MVQMSKKTYWEYYRFTLGCISKMEQEPKLLLCIRSAQSHRNVIPCHNIFLIIITTLKVQNYFWSMFFLVLILSPKLLTLVESFQFRI